MSENTYEITYIVNSVLGDDQINNLVGRVTKFIEKEGGNIIEVDEWGSQRLAYAGEILHKSKTVVAQNRIGLKRCREQDGRPAYPAAPTLPLPPLEPPRP